MGKLKCLGCKYNSTKCIHVDMIRKGTHGTSAEVPNVAYDLIAKEGSNWLPTSYRMLKAESCKAIPFKISSELGNKLSIGYSNFLEMNGEFLMLPNNARNCRNCGSCLGLDGGRDSSILLYTKLRPIRCKVFTKDCTICNIPNQYDGSEDGILNMGKFLIGYDILRDYMYHFLFGGSSTLRSFYCALTRQQEDIGHHTFKRDFSYQHWRASWYAFLNLLQIPYDEWIVCSDCGDCPDIIVCDGTSLGFRKQLLSKLSEEGEKTDIIKRYSLYRERLAISEPKVRSMFEKWTRLWRSNEEKKIDVQDAERLTHILRTEYPEIFKLFRWANDSRNLTKPMLEFFLCLSSGSPVCSYLPPSESCKTLLQQLCTPDVKKKPFLIRELQDSIPLLYNVLCSVNEMQFPPCLQSFFDWLYSIASAPFMACNSITGPALQQVEEELAFFPSLPKRRERGNYEMDYRLSAVKEDEPCTKRSHGHPSLTCGIFTIYCPHGLNYGFQVMESSESPNIPFAIFRTRFLKAPSTIIYDNACNLHTYCLNRDPVHFKNTKFVVDRFHWKNHSGCCSAYNISQYPGFRSINSQVNEQQNSTLKRLRSQLSYMGPENFMAHCKFFLWFRNSETLYNKNLQ